MLVIYVVAMPLYYYFYHIFLNTFSNNVKLEEVSETLDSSTYNQGNKLSFGLFQSRQLLDLQQGSNQTKPN